MHYEISNLRSGVWQVLVLHDTGRMHVRMEVHGTRERAESRGRWAIAKANGELREAKYAAREYFRASKQYVRHVKRARA